MRRRRGATRSEASGKARKQIDEDSWRAELDAISINDDSWWCIVAIMVETITEHSRCVSIFNAAAEEGRRKAIYSLSCQKALDAVRVLSKQSLDKCPPIQGVCHYANKVLNEDNGALPSWLMARIIKYLIYRAKEENIGIEKRLANLEKEIDEEYLIMQTVADWGQPGSKGFNPEVFNSKANTKLRRRDEAWRDAVYVDDAPLNGPNLYVILTGFHDPDLPQYLINATVPLTCILRIKRPNERLDRNVERGSIEVESSGTKKLQFNETYKVNAASLFNFWTTIEERLLNPEQYPEYGDTMFLIFCPLKLQEVFDDERYEALKKDMYDDVSHFVYDIYDLYRQHGNYLKSMKVEKSIFSDEKGNKDMDVYETFLDALPPECVSVPLILFAILMQVEENQNKSMAENFVDEKGDARISEKTSIDAETKPETLRQSPISFVEQKLKTLNVKFDLEEPHTPSNGEQSTADIELILHGDNLNEAIHLLDDSAIARFPNAVNLIDSILPIFWHPSVGLHSKHEISGRKLDEYSHHIGNSGHYFDFEICNEEVRHYLHILMFDRILFQRSRLRNQILKDASSKKTVNTINLGSSVFSLKRSKSVPSLTSKFTPKIYFQSDGNIDYGKIVPTIVECSPLFDLIDPREMLVPGYLEENLFKARRKLGLHLEDFNDVELLSKPIFLQLVHECLRSFDCLELRYFEPTDSLLLYFGNQRKLNGVREEERMSSIRTPVCLRDFCDYVVAEEEDWIRREEELYILQTTKSIGRLMKKSAEMYDESLLFRDEDFILPGSLKARDLEKSENFLKRNGTLETESPSSAEETAESPKKKKGKKKKASKKKKQKGDKATNERSSSKNLNLDTQPVSTSKRSSLTEKVAEETDYEFIGYDLGRLRVQVKNSRKTFYSADDTLVQVEMEDWLYSNKDLRITVVLRGYSLRLYHRINDRRELGKMFHLTSATGIILAFEKLQMPQREQRNHLQNTWQHVNVDFRASWPTGLVIEPIIGTGPENPFYICQSYISKRYGSTNGVREVCRKFLRNGTVLKYLDDGNIIVLRPNGVVVTCTAFEKLQLKRYEGNDDEVDFSKGDRSSTEAMLSKTRRKRTSSSKSQVDGMVEKGPMRAQLDSTTNDSSAPSMTDTMTFKVSRYTVLDHDGRRYEVLDDLVVSEHHRLLVRTSSDYEVDEKFTRRGDGTNMLLKSDGELIVGFPDGTRITSGYTIEKEPVICDWTEEEILRYFVSYGAEGEACYVGASFPNLKVLEEANSRFSLEGDDEITNLLIADSFVSILLTCRVEHKNYATVFYDQSAVSCTLSMPDDLRVSISRRGHYEVSMADGVNLKIEEDNLSFKGNACTTCGGQSTSTYNFFQLDSQAVIFTTTDVFGNIFEVKNDGATRYRRKRPSRRRKSNSKVDVLEPNKGEEGYEEAHDQEYDEEENFELGCNHDSLCFEAKSNQYRIFSMNRNLTAYEYLHRSASNRAEQAVFDNKMSVILYPTSRRPKLRRLIILEPVMPESRLKNELSFQHGEMKPTNFDRRDLIRSTYSIPYDWKFPFGRNGDGIWKNTYDLPLMSSLEQKPPKLLKIRILYGFKEPGGNAVIDLQRALGRYWMSLVCNIPESPITKIEEDKQSLLEEAKTIYEHLEDDLHDLSLGVKKVIDMETYKSGLDRRWQVPKITARRKSIKFDELLQERVTNQEEFEWYKRCMRERFILPYFQNIVGTCFLWIKECAENAVKISLDKSSES